MKLTPTSYINHLINLPGESLVRLYSYQGHEAFNRALEKGYWTGADLAPDDDDVVEKVFTPAYAWMQEKMQERVPSYSGDLPMWAWLKRPSTRPSVYNKYQNHLTDKIRLTVLVPRSRIVFSDYDTWHHVLNRWHLSRTEVESEKNFSSEEIRASWDRCLEFVQTQDPEVNHWMGSTKRFQVQACVDRFYLNEVVAMRRF